MKCIVPGPNVKVLGRAIHCLAKLGDDLYVQFTPKDLLFQTVNMSETTCAVVSFGSNFFSLFSSVNNNDKSSDCIKCHISMKSCLAVFRSPLALEKTIDSCQITVEPNSEKLVFVMKYKRGVIKTFYVPIIESEKNQIYSNKDNLANKFSIESKTVVDVLSNFKRTVNDISWLVTKDQVTFKSHFSRGSKTEDVHTLIHIQRCEFDLFEIQLDTAVVFCIKELRAIVLFAESVGLPLTAHFDVAEKPIHFYIHSEVFEVRVVVSTMSDSDSQTQLRATQERTASSNRAEEEHQVAAEIQQLLNEDYEELNLHPEVVENDNRDRLKRVFQRCFDKQPFDIRTMPGYNQVLAPDSDPE